MTRPLVLIPARLRASRLPGKPLAEIGGVPMIVQVMRRAREADIGEVVVATDDAGIAEAVRSHGGTAAMTRPDHPSGSDRLHEALEALDPEGRHRVVVNVQGDLPTIDPAAVAASIVPLADREVDIATLVAIIEREEEEKTNPNVVKMVGSPIAPGRFRALYFTRATAPYGDGPLYHHIGLYAYRWFTPDSPADLARVGQCEPYRAALARLDAGLDSEIAADPREIEMVVDECERQGH